MSEHWKSTPRYWCKHCSVYVRDTKLERQNHESTAKHQGALKRFLRDLHRGHEKEEREKERARHEIARVTGVVAGSSSSSTAAVRQTSTQHGKPGIASEAQLKKQREQLAELGVAMPSEFRPEMAMPGEWKVTSTRVIEDKKEDGEENKEARASGVRKREATEDEKEEEAAVRGLFKRPRKWGRDSKAMPEEEDKDLDALLSGSVLALKPPKSEEGEEGENTNDEDRNKTGEPNIKKEEDGDPIKPESDGDADGLRSSLAQGGSGPDASIKTEEASEASPAAVVFKKRKPKGLRQK